LVYITHDGNRVHELSCLVEGETRAFSVEIRLDGAVSKLKEKIKSRIQHDLDSVDTNIWQEIWLLWSTVLEEMSLVLSGTGIDLRALEETLLSTACKGHEYTIMNEHRRLRE